MARIRTDAVTVRPSNTMLTALSGAACAVVLLAIIMIAAMWSNVVGDDPEAPKLFFGLFWPL